MRKKLSLALALSMVMSSTAFAADAGSVQGVKDTHEIVVSGVYQEEYAAETVISVDVKWDSMNFIYAEKSTGDWNPLTHAFENGFSSEDGPKWVKDSSDITVTNHSNSEIAAKFQFEADDNSDVEGSFSKSSLSLASAAEGDSLGDRDKAPTETTTFQITDGSLGDSETENTDLGVITVLIGTGTTEVATEEALVAALELGGNIKLTDDIVITESHGWAYLDATQDMVLDLNGHTLSKETSDEVLLMIGDAGSVTVKNGTVKNNKGTPLYAASEEVRIENCTLIAGAVESDSSEALRISTSRNTTDIHVVVSNSTLKGGFQVSEGAVLDITDNVTLENDSAGYMAFSVVDGGILKCSVNPLDYTTFATYFEVIDNEDGTWTVQPKAD